MFMTEHILRLQSICNDHFQLSLPFPFERLKDNHFMLSNVFSERKLFTFSFDGEKKWYDGTTIWTRKKNSRSYFKFRKCCEKMYFVLMKIKMRASAPAIEANICEISKKGEHTTQNNSPFNNENFENTKRSGKLIDFILLFKQCEKRGDSLSLLLRIGILKLYIHTHINQKKSGRKSHCIRLQ